MLLAVAAQAQIKMHSNGRITFQTLENTNSKGVSISPAPICNVDINGTTFFHKGVNFTYNSGAYVWMHCALASNDHAAAWVVSPDWTTPNFFVYGKGDAYAKHHYTITSSSATRTSNEEDSEPIIGSKALEVISGLNGFYFATEELEIPDLENNENVAPDAVEAMYADFGKRSVGLAGTDFVEAFPEGVRTDPQNRLCISYSSVVTMLVEAVKEQQKEIEELRKALEENGLMKKQR